MSKKNKDIETIIRRAEETLETARHGFDDLTSSNKTRRSIGLRNLIVFGRSVTFVLQNLRSVIEEDFDSWYKQEQEKMREDPLMRYFVEARNILEKRGQLNIALKGRVKFTDDDIRKLGPGPPGTTGFFIGDKYGGTGWEVKMPDGTTEKYYIDLPPEIGEMKQVFSNFPEAEAPEFENKSIEEICEIYLKRLEVLLNDARKQFLEQTPEKKKGKRLPPYLKVIK
jgi:hypothetical protein